MQLDHEEINRRRTLDKHARITDNELERQVAREQVIATIQAIWVNTRHDTPLECLLDVLRFAFEQGVI